MTDLPQNFIGRYRGRISFGTFSTLTVGIPGYLYSTWENFGTNKSPFQWFADKGWGWRQVIIVALCWLIVTGAVSLGLHATLAAVSRSVDRRRKGSRPSFPTLGNDTDRLTVSMRGMNVTWELKYFERESGYPIDETWTGGFPLRVYVRDRKPLIAARVYSGSEFLEINDNKLVNRPPRWDENFNDRAVEIVNEKQGPVFQLIFDPPNRITINGIFSESDKPSLRPIFKYPTSEYGFGHHDLRPPEIQSQKVLAEQQPQLDITFDENAPGFVHIFDGKSIDRQETVKWKLYRVAVTSRSSSPWTRLRADYIKLKGGDEYDDLFLRIKGRPQDKNQTQLHKGVAQKWDVVEKPVGSEWLRLTHAEPTLPELLLQAPCEFNITASCDEGFTKKLVKLGLDRDNNNELIVRLEDAN